MPAPRSVQMIPGMTSLPMNHCGGPSGLMTGPRLPTMLRASDGWMAMTHAVCSCSMLRRHMAAYSANDVNRGACRRTASALISTTAWPP